MLGIQRYSRYCRLNTSVRKAEFRPCLTTPILAMIKKISLAIFGCFLIVVANATHIVGGEIELQHVSGNIYTLRLIQYFDARNGNPGAEDASVTIAVFSKRTANQVASYTLPQFSNERVPYTNLDCTIGDLSTRKIVYQLTIELSDNNFNESEGYYAIWERCCRNNTINNIVAPGQTGQTFFLEFPAIVREGEPFLNSTPTLFPPLSDYACVNRPFYFDFGGEDVDGDSLVYSLAAPFNSSLTGVPIPPPTAPPHPKVTFLPGLSGFTPIPADLGKGLKITTEGFLTVTPNAAGLFVFSVRVSEYRDGEKIGEVRRDFQMLVLDGCEPAIPPKIAATLPNGDPYVPGDTVYFAFEDPRCFNLYVTDEEKPGESVSVEVHPVNFNTDEDLNALAAPRSGLLGFGSDSLSVEICLPKCPFLDGEPYILDFVAFDDACAKPLTDTVRMYIFVEVPPNEMPIASTTAPTDTLVMEFDQTLNFHVLGEDPDGDTLDLYLMNPPFDFDAIKMEFDSVTGIANVSSPFSWSLDCDVVRLGTQDIYPLTFVVEDRDVCEQETADTIRRVIKVVPIENSLPVLTSEIIGGGARLEEDIWTVDLNEPLTIRVTGTDADPYPMQLFLENRGDKLLQFYELDFAPITGTGSISGDINWHPSCKWLVPGQTKIGPLSLEFVLNDDFCIFPSSDTLRLTIQAKDIPPSNDEFKAVTIFTPNGDGHNEAFDLPELPTGNCFGQFEEVNIFNRWGEQIFQSNQRKFAWQGTGSPDGVYYWIVSYTNGTTLKGTVALYR